MRILVVSVRTKHSHPADACAHVLDVPVAEADLADAVRARWVERGWEDEWADEAAESFLRGRVRGVR